MSDRFKGLAVAFKDDIRDDDAQKIIDAILLLRGVADVQPVIGLISDHISRMRINQEWQDALLQLIQSKDPLKAGS